jgi:hypothetical protein
MKLAHRISATHLREPERGDFIPLTLEKSMANASATPLFDTFFDINIDPLGVGAPAQPDDPSRLQATPTPAKVIGLLV